MAEHFGEHVMIDGYGGNPTLLDDRAQLERCLTELPEQLGMHVLSVPLVCHAPDNAIKDPGGWSGVVVIAESHISIHTFPRRRFVSIDVYTCRNGIDVDAVVAYFTQAYQLETVEQHFVARGTQYPDHNVV